jgi:hypothetical protein
MTVKIELKEFLELEKCKSFINNFIKNKKLNQIKVIPIALKNNELKQIKYLSYIEYEDLSD